MLSTRLFHSLRISLNDTLVPVLEKSDKETSPKQNTANLADLADGAVGHGGCLARTRRGAHNLALPCGDAISVCLEVGKHVLEDALLSHLQDKGLKRL